VLAVHLAVSVGWIGAAVGYLEMGIAAERSESAATIRSAWVAMDIIGWFVIVPLAFAAVASGVALAAGTRWGLFRHCWVIFSLVDTRRRCSSPGYWIGRARARPVPERFQAGGRHEARATPGYGA